MTVVESINATVDDQFLSTAPRILDHGRLTDISRLLDDVELAKSVDAPLCGKAGATSDADPLPP